MIRRSIWIVGAIAVAASACRGQEPTPQRSDEAELAVPVAAEAAQIGRIRAVTRATGVVTPATGSEFLATATEPTRILEIPNAEGDMVAAGDLLVRFDVSAATSEVARRRAEGDRAQALLEQIRITQSRTRELFDRGIVSRREMEDADRQVSDAQADVGRAEAAHALAEEAIARGLVRAPFSGVIAQRFHNPGDLVQGVASDPILRLVDPARVEVLASIDPADLAQVLPGATARVTSVAGAQIPLRVASPAAVPLNGVSPAASVRLLFAEPATLAVDTPVAVEIDGGEREAVLIPVDAVVRRDDEAFVMVAAGTVAERRVIVTGLEDSERIEVVSGLEPGEFVITRGHVGLPDGAAISVATQAQSSNVKGQRSFAF